MSASSSLIADMGTVISNGPSATTKDNAIAAAGPIMGYPDNCNLVSLRFKEASVLLTQVKTDVDSTDSANLALVNGILAALNGTTSPSTQVITDITAVYNSTFNAASQAKAIAAAGPIQDLYGNTKLVQLKLREAKVLTTAIKSVTDSGSDSANNTLLANILLTLV